MLVILDRDGVINEDSRDFVKSVDEWVPIDGSIEAIAALSKAGFSVAIASNQSGIARELFDATTLEAMHQELRELVAGAGGKVDLIVVCPHGPDDDCDCRKPKPGMLMQIAAHFDVSLCDVPAIGDSLRDLEAANAVGARPILVRTGNGWRIEKALPPGFDSISVFDDLATAANALLAE
jgi:D-glycero-D-manno-heptose 1,7-bisphosphate phosphatase